MCEAGNGAAKRVFVFLFLSHRHTHTHTHTRFQTNIFNYELVVRVLVDENSIRRRSLRPKAVTVGSSSVESIISSRHLNVYFVFST